jgi:hypothetical protein
MAASKAELFAFCGVLSRPLRLDAPGIAGPQHLALMKPTARIVTKRCGARYNQIFSNIYTSYERQPANKPARPAALHATKSSGQATKPIGSRANKTAPR